MPILNYTTDVPAERSIAEIQKILTRHGARRLLIENDGAGSVIGIAFEVQGPEGLMGFRLPVEWDRVRKVLENQKLAPRYRTDAHAYRVAWRIIKVWIEAQMAILETRMVTLDQVFLPYAITKLGNTLYQEMKDSGHLLLKGGE